MRRILNRLYNHNIIKIAVDDFRILTGNTIAIIVIIGIIIVPSLYAWFNIAAGWDPYGNTGNLRIAIVNNDAGYDSDTISLELNVGDRLISEVGTNKDFDWVITDEKTAIEAVKAGDYYAAIIMPENFSECILSLLNRKPTKAAINYYCNEKANAIAPIIIDQGASELQNKVEQKFIEMVVDISLSMLNDIVDADNGNFHALIGNLEDNLADMELDIRMAAETMTAFSDSLASISTLVNTGAIASCKQQIESYRATLRKLSPYLPEKINNEINRINVKADNLTNKTRSDYAKICKDMNAAAASLNTAANEIADLKGDLHSAQQSSDLSKIKKIINQDRSEVGAFFAQPVALDTISSYPVSNNGTAMTPFYTCLTLWVGGTIMAALISVNLEAKRRKELLNFHYYQEYFGRGAMFFFIGIMQALVVLMGDLWYLEIDCKHPGLFILAGLVAGAVFVNIIYTFTTSFADIGKAICVFLLVMQVAGSGGTLPVELVPGVFRAVNPLLPFTHAMTAMKEAIFGMYGNTYWIELGILCMYLAFTFALGLLFRIPVIRMNKFFMRKLEESKIFFG